MCDKCVYLIVKNNFLIGLCEFVFKRFYYNKLFVDIENRNKKKNKKIK